MLVSDVGLKALGCRVARVCVSETKQTRGAVRGMLASSRRLLLHGS